METNFPSENIIFRDKVFFTIVEEISKKKIEEKIYHSIIKNFIKRFIMINDILREPKESSYFKNCTKIYNKVFIHLEDIDTVFKIHNDQNFMTDFISFLIKVIFDSQINCSNSNTNNNQGSNNNLTINFNTLKDGNNNGITGIILFFIFYLLLVLF